MALISNEGEPISSWWLRKGIEIVKSDRDIFSNSRMREARQIFIAGANRVKTIKGWMVAAQLIDNKQNSREYSLTEYGLAIYKNDLHLSKSATWWSFHLSLCFSPSSEPYPTLFRGLDSVTKDWMPSSRLLDLAKVSLKDETGNEYKVSTLESLISSVRRMFSKDNPLAGLGLLEIRKQSDDEDTLLRFGSPTLSDEVIIHALSLARFGHFPGRVSVDFTALAQVGINNFLCCSKDLLRQHLQRMSQMYQWQEFFSFDHAVDLDSITFKDSCTPEKTVLLLLQKGQDTWL